MTAISNRYRDLPVRRREVITRTDIDVLAARKQPSITIGEYCTITDEARELALKLGISVQYGKPQNKTAVVPSPPASPRQPPVSASAVGGVPDAIVAVLRDMKVPATEDLIRLIIERVSTALTAPRS